MIRPFLSRELRLPFSRAADARRMNGLRPTLELCAIFISLLLASMLMRAQVITVNTQTGAVTNSSTGTTTATIDRRYQQITPTHVPLTKSTLDAKTRLELIRVLQSEQGFAMRPFPRGHKGLTLIANGKLEPAGENYLNMVIAQGVSAKPGDRVVLSDIKIEHSKIVIQLNDGPDAKHRLLSHIQIGAGPNMNPVTPTDDKEPTGARLTLEFKEGIPEVTGTQVKALLAPLISFDVKTPVEAFTDTLPVKLKEAILGHQVLVGMSTDMVIFAKGQPEKKSREREGQMPFEEWIYGQPPQEVDFVRINGNRVIRVEVAKVGETPVIFTKDEVAGLMRTDGTAIIPAESNTHTVASGDVQRDPDTQAPAAPPTLRNPGETLPADGEQRGTMKPVRFPKPHTDTDPSGQAPAGQPASQPGTNPNDESAPEPAPDSSSPPK